MKPSGPRVLFVLTAIAIALAARDVSTRQQSVTITLPTAISFPVTNVGATTIGVPGSTRIQFSGAVLSNNRAVRFQVRADSDFVPPGGAAIPAARVSWTTSGAVNGIGYNGTLSRTAYTTLFEGNEEATSGRIDVIWRLAAPAVTPLRAGAHVLTMRWRIQQFNP